MVRDQVATGFDPETNMSALRQRADAKVEAARLTLKDHPSDLEGFERALQRARIAYPVREDSEFFTVSVPLGLARLAVLELGTRLASRGQIATRDDVFLLEYDQARKLFASAEEAFDVVQRRKGERAWILAHPGPGSYGPDPGPPPSLAGFPPEVRFAMGALLWAVERTFETELSARIQDDPGRIQGIGASPGTYSGTARRVMDETQFDKIRAGDVLVCPITSPVWSVVFPSLGALVADTGGILSHPAIIAREYQIPAVVATGNATSLINDGQRVTVDGTTGIVEIR
jgi:pyruvate,water dikinase